MGKLLYNGIMKRWLYGADIDENINRKSAIFKEGYDDPTYMTFRIEFGDWGASVLDRSIIQTGTTVFRPTFNDYDALPIGLLNCPAPGNSDNAYWQSDSPEDYTNFNNIRMYSAFQYLRSRNEDTRAKYLYYFVNGLFEIQKNYPFIFKKISGVQELEKFDPASGQRLKTPAKITLECFEGLDLRIRTLMEFYRKAAWDDVYQRWILPENMREFKMIIYVFERRIFQDSVAFPNGNDRATYKNAFEIYSSLNADIPVKAYECCPCEFAIGESVSWGNDYSGSIENQEETSKIVINVKNVKTYYKNRLVSEELSKIYDNNGKFLGISNDVTQKIDSIMIYDLVESIERTSSLNNNLAESESTPGGVFSNLTVNGAKALFLNKNILLENEEANPVIANYIWGYSLSGPVLNINERVLNHMVKTDQQMLYILDNEAYRGGWMFSLTTPPTYDENKTFWQNLGDNVKNVLTGTRRLILMTGAANLQIVPNCLIDYGPYLPPYSYNPIVPYNNGLGYNRIANIELTSRTLSDQEFKELEPEREIKDQQFIELTSRELSEQEYKELEEPRELSQQQFSELTSRESPKQEYRELEPERQLPDQEFSELSSREIPQQQFNELSGRQVPDQEFEELEEPREIPEQQYKDLNAREIPDQEYMELEDPREIPEQDYRELNAREIPEQQYEELEEPREIPGQQYKNLEVPREISEQQYGELEEPRELPKQQYKDLNTRDVPEQQYKNLEEPREVPEQQYKNLESHREITEQQYKNLEEPRKIPEQDYRLLNPERVPDTELMNLLLVARSLPGFKDMPLEEVRKLPKQDLLDLTNATERSVPSLKADRAVILEEISKVENTNTKLLELDKDNKTAEEKALEMLKQNQALSGFRLQGGEKDEDEKTKKLKNITLFTKEFTENSDKVKNAYVKSVLEMKGQLKNVTREIVNKLPIEDTYIVKKGEKDHNNINSVLASKNDIDQINHNMKYLAINDNDVPKLSFQTLIQLHEELGDALQRSQAVEGLTAITKNSVATNPDQKTREKAKHSVIKDTPKKKIEVIY